jgi:FtsZ-binding cell division protein ZapB
MRNGMDIQINGSDGPSMRLKIGFLALVQVIVALATFFGAMKVMSMDVERLKQGQQTASEKIDRMLETQARMETTIQQLREEVRYYRERLDRHIEKNQ